MKRTNSALTLVELLIASSIFVIIMTAVYSAFHAGIFGQRRIEGAIDIFQNARQVFGRIDLDFRNAFAFSSQDAKFLGNKNDLSFLTLVNTFSDNQITRDYSFVAYKLERDKLMRLCRKNQAALNEKSGKEPEELAAYIKGLNFSYGYVEADSTEIRWKDSWEDKTAMPDVLRITLTVGDKTKQEFVRTIFLP